MKINIGDIVSVSIGEDAQTYICAGKIGNKYKLVLPGNPKATITTDKSCIVRTGPWR